jgi:predicted Zn-dependent protease with MMP-like domain
MSARGVDWTSAKAPSLEEFEAIAAAALAELPEHFRKLCAGVLIQIADFPDDEVAREMEIESPFELLGLFTGVGMAEDGAVPETGRMPNSIFLYRRPILDYWAEHDETLGADHHACARARDRPPFRLVRQRHGSDRSGCRRSARLIARLGRRFAACYPSLRT